MTNFIRIPLAIDILLMAFEKVSPDMSQGVLPVGGSAFVQLAVLVLFGIAAHELFSKNKKK